MIKSIFKRVAPYADDALNLPVADVASAISFYQETFGFHVVSRTDRPPRSVVLARDDIQIGLAENGGDPAQEGCYFEVDDIEAAFREIKGHAPGPSDIRIDKHRDRTLRVFFVVAPDGLCYMLGQPLA